MLQLFARPGWLLLFLALPGLALLFGYARRRRRQALAALGQVGMLRRMQIVSTSGRRWQNTLMLVSLTFLIFACAEPQWGSELAETRTPGHDVVVVLDVSRSMLAEQPTRRTLATRALKDLATTLGRDGSTRIGLVLFAGRPRVLTPLTLDYEQFQNVLRDVDDDVLPPEIWPDKNGEVTSGTRIGAALEKAVHLLGNDPARLRDILLLSDGDDPKNDQEHLRGAEAARRQDIPIHVVGIGDPKQPWNLRLDSQTVETVLKEKLLQDLAQRTGGVYIPSQRTSQLPLGRLFREVQAGRQAQWIRSPDIVALKKDVSQGLPQKIGRQAWFLAAALALFTAMLLIPLRPAPLAPPSRKADFPAVPAAGRRLTRTAAKALVALSSLVLISAAPLPSVEEHIRQGNQAYHQGKFADALKRYEQAATVTLDPGLVAFNQGAAWFRLERFDEAASHYRRCLEDAAIPQERRARANYDLGNALVQQAKAANARLLDQAAQAYRVCLETATDPILKTDAAHNLEVARWLWKQALARPQPEPPGTEKLPNDPKKQHDPKPKNIEDDPKKKDDGKASKDPGMEGKDDPGLSKDKGNGKDKKDHPGALLVIPELQQVEQGKVTPAQSAAFLEEQAQRIRGERRLYRREASRGGEGVPNW